MSNFTSCTPSCCTNSLKFISLRMPYQIQYTKEICTA
jgi:hypothetical protein